MVGIVSRTLCLKPAVVRFRGVGVIEKAHRRNLWAFEKVFYLKNIR